MHRYKQNDTPAHEFIPDDIIKYNYSVKRHKSSLSKSLGIALEWEKKTGHEPLEIHMYGQLDNFSHYNGKPYCCIVDTDMKKYYAWGREDALQYSVNDAVYSERDKGFLLGVVIQ